MYVAGNPISFIFLSLFYHVIYLFHIFFKVSENLALLTKMTCICGFLICILPSKQKNGDGGGGVIGVSWSKTVLHPLVRKILDPPLIQVINKNNGTSFHARVNSKRSDHVKVTGVHYKTERSRIFKQWFNFGTNGVHTSLHLSMFCNLHPLRLIFIPILF